MKKNVKQIFVVSLLSLMSFVMWTLIIQTVDVQPIGVNGTLVGLASINKWIHEFTSVNMSLYVITDWLGLVPIFVCMIFAFIGLYQLIKRKSLFKVDIDIILLGIYYVIVIIGYLVFEMIPINYRPILIQGFMEASYPSSTTLLVLCVMPTLNFQLDQRMKKNIIKKVIKTLSIVFSFFMVIGRLVSGVHWFSDIVGSLMLSLSLFYLYKGIVYCFEKKS